MDVRALCRGEGQRLHRDAAVPARGVDAKPQGLQGRGHPYGVRFQKKWQIALDQLDAALKWGVRQHVVLADAGYGAAREFRDGVRERGLHYLMGVQGTHKVWPPGAKPQKPEKVPG
nr:transposase [Pyxidicoccus fallax]